MKIKSLLLRCFILQAYFSLPAAAQDYSYRHYDIKDGLAGNHVYSAVSDRDNFLWFSTETGVSRFDGTRFKNFTTADGLPDNEILKLFVDSRNRVWMIPFKSQICYYSGGRLHNHLNDSVLAKLQLNSNVVNIAEDKNGNIVLLDNSGLVVIRPSGRISRYRTPPLGHPDAFIIICMGTSRQNDIMLAASYYPVNLTLTRYIYQLEITADTFYTKRIYEEIGFRGGVGNNCYIGYDCIVYPQEMSSDNTQQLYLFDTRLRRAEKVNVPAELNWLSLTGDSIYYFNTSKGVYEYNITRHRFTAVYLSGQAVSGTITDSENNLWFISPGNGIWRLNSKDVKSIRLNSDEPPPPVFSAMRQGNIILAGSTGRSLSMLDAATGKPLTGRATGIFSPKKFLKLMRHGGRIYCLTETGIYSSDTTLSRFEKVSLSAPLRYTFKDIDIRTGTADTTLLAVASHAVSFCMKLPGSKEDVKYYGGRSTAICFGHGGIYIGTLSGLIFTSGPDSSQALVNLDALLANRITKLAFAQEKLWIGTNDNGVICFDGKKVIKNISTKQGLTSNIVRTLFVEGDYLWVGTDRGLNKIAIADTSCPVVLRCTTTDGLASDMIHTVYAEAGQVYVGTPQGLTIFDEDKISGQSRCDLRLLGITISGKEIPFDSSILYLKHRDNNIRFDFAAISFKSAGDIVYRYRLDGIDNDWQSTRENFLFYPTLPSGTYRLQLQATNKYGVKSEVLTIRFEVAPTLAEEPWFRILLLLAVLGITWMVAGMRTRRIRRRDREKAQTAARIAELEQQALKAQMNPHFVFNCLNSIQQYVIDKDVEGANRFISGFSRLIRQTMENSSKPLISVAEEESFLNTYLQLEKNRFENRFVYRITIDEAIHKDEVLLPPMLLQPFAENSIRHGIRHRQDGGGIVEINISLESNQLICTVSDNGIGREAAKALKGRQHIEYQSRGMQLTSQRIELLNRSIEGNISLSVEDLAENGKPCGTRVKISLPLQYTLRKQHG